MIEFLIQWNVDHKNVNIKKLCFYMYKSNNNTSRYSIKHFKQYTQKAI